MRFLRLTLVVCVMVTSVAAMAQEPIPISELHYNDPMGIPLLLDQIVTIQGVVTVPTGVFNSSRTDVYIQDETGGMNLFSFDPVATYNAGDLVKVTGTVIAYRGLTEVEPIEVELIATDQPEPEPLVLTCAEVRDTYDFDTNFEANESRLVRVNNVTWDPGNYALMDDTGTAMMYIVASTGIPFPEGEFNVVGVIKQFDDAGEEGPFYLGYEVLPRYVSDITYGSGPQFVELPEQTGVAMGGATISWTTDQDCETILEYGTTTDFEMEPLKLGNSTSTHEAVLTGLDSATVYYCRAVATDGTDSVTSPMITIISPSANSSGDISVYFSQSVETKYSTGVDAVQTNIADRMIELINAATSSIDFCFYSFTHDGVADALIEAHDRGVDVQVIYEVFDPVINELIVAGIDVVTDPDEEHENTHNKFAVFDARDGDETNDVVWTGSWNASYNGTNENAENAVVIHDAALATTYTIEFDEMWGGTFSNNKVENTPHMFLIGGRQVEQYMSPTDGLKGELSDFIATADSDVLFAIYSFTESTITNALTDRYNAGVTVRGVFDADAAEYEYSQYQPLFDLGADVVLDDVEQGGPDQLMHHKYLMTDPLAGGTDPAVVTGSYNWTYTADTYKDENILIIHDATITNIFFQEWMARYHEGGGTWDIEVPEELTADFTYAPMEISVGSEVTFTDASTGDPAVDTWSWDFGDGLGTSTEQNPTYTYSAAGTYMVSLTVTNSEDTDTVEKELTVTAGGGTLDNLYYVPAAAKAEGSAGAFFVSDLVINNAGNSQATFQFLWLPRNEDNAEPTASMDYTIDAGVSTLYPDILGEAFGVQDGAVGALAVASNSSDLLLMSRTYNLVQEGAPCYVGATFGQSIPGYAAGDLVMANEIKRILFFVENDEFRSNLGLMNGTGENVRIMWTRYAADGTAIDDGFKDLPPWGNTQLNSVFSDQAPISGAYVDVWTETPGGAFAAYGSVLDNTTSDPTTVLPQ